MTPAQAAREACASTARLATFLHEAAQKTADQLATLRALRAADPVMTEHPRHISSRVRNIER